MLNENNDNQLDEDSDKIAVVGIAGRYPQCNDLTGFWENLVNGRDCLESVTDEELIELGIPESIFTRSDFVRRGTRLPDMDCFDARFFGFTPKEAQLMDPQSRIFLETSYHSLENAGYNPTAIDGRVGVFAGSNPNDYAALLGVADPADSLSAFGQLIGSDKDFLATRVSHRLNLKGPALTVQTACSTSLVAVHLAIQSLLTFESDMALAGGVTVNLRQGVGYLYQEGMILSREGKCRAFDDNASGTTLGQGCGVVVLKRLTDAIADHDHIYAVVLGSAINNDGGQKVTYTAPSEDGQTECIQTAIELADVSPDSIGYIETHGTGTKLGDPIEIAALARAYGSDSDKKQYCAVGSVKSNYGHTDAAAGITGFIKTVLSLYNKKIVPSIHFEHANKEIDFSNSPFYVNTETIDWHSNENPLRAGVSAFGIGGTNAHVILEESPARKATLTPDLPLLFPLSAQSEPALDTLTKQMSQFLLSSNGLSLLDAAHTLIYGRNEFEHRAAIVIAEAHDGPQLSVVKGKANNIKPKLIWLYSGQGAQYSGMCADLYETEEVFKNAMAKCGEFFNPLLDTDLCKLIFDSEFLNADTLLAQTSLTQPALFSVEYALSQMLESWGMQPDAVVGHSIGEFAAAVQCGVMSFESAATAVYHRGRLMQSMVSGDMYAIEESAEKVLKRLPDGLEIAVINAANSCVVSGASDLVSTFANDLNQDGIHGSMVNTSHAFHSAMMNGAANEFEQIMDGIVLCAPSLPMTSNVTGLWMTDAQATSSAYWASQIRSTVRFSECISTAKELGNTLFLEVGPGRTLSSLVRRIDNSAELTLAVNLVRHRSVSQNDQTHARQAIGKLWCGGIELSWTPFQQQDKGTKTPLPGYPFERVRHWGPSRRHQLALPILGEQPSNSVKPLLREQANKWLYAPSWDRIPLPRMHGKSKETNNTDVRIVLLPDCTVQQQKKIDDYFDGLRNIFVYQGDEFNKIDANSFSVNASNEGSFEQFFDALASDELHIKHVIHAWLANCYEKDNEPEKSPFSSSVLEADLASGLFTAHTIARCSRKLIRESAQLDFITTGAHSVTGNEYIRPSAAALLGPAKVIPLEYPGVTCRHIDLEKSLVEHCHSDILRRIVQDTNQTAILAIRGSHQWRYKVSAVDCIAAEGSQLKANGRYLLVGGLGGVGLSIAEHLVDNYNASLVLTGRKGRIENTAEVSEANSRLALLNKIESKCENFAVLAADAADLQSMTEVVAEAEKRLGGIDGVIVAAGVADQSGSIHRRTRAQSKEAIKSKVHGSYILCDLFKDREIDFILFSSSIASMLHHNRFGQVGYVTANSFVEAMAHKARQCGIPAVTVAWDDWMNIGMSVRAAAEFSEKYGSEVKLVDELHSFSPADGVVQFEHSLNVGEPILYVSTTDLQRRIDDDVNTISPFLEQAISTHDSEQPDDTGDTVALIKSAWQDILGYDSIANDDDFFDLGGDSLQAARLADRLSRGLKVAIGLNLVFDNPKFSDMCHSIDALNPVDKQKVEDASSVGVFPLAPAQKRFLERKSANTNHFNISVMLQSAGEIDIEKLEEAFNWLVYHNDSLRLRLRGQSIDTDQYFVSADDEKVSLQRLQIVSFDSHETEMVLTEVQQSLDLINGPIYRVLLIETASGQQTVMFLVHHMVFDRVSLLLFLDSLNYLYDELCNEKVPELSAKTTGYAEWLEKISTHAIESQEYTKKWLDFPTNNIGRLPVHSDYQSEFNTNDSTGNLKVLLSPGLSEKLSNSLIASVDELLLLALGSSIADWSDNESALIEVLKHGRRHVSNVDVSRSMGFFLSYNPVVVSRSSACELSKSVQKIRSWLEWAWSYDFIKYYHPNESIRKKMDNLPRAEVLFNFVGKAIAADKTATLQTVDVNRGRETSTSGIRGHLLSVMAQVNAQDQIEITMVYSKKFLTKGNMQQLRTLYLDELNDLITT